MIYFVQGDLLESGAEALVNPVNCVGVMGKGLPLQFKKKFPGYFANYKQACDAGGVRLGRVTSYKGVGVEKLVSFPTKNHWKDLSNYVSVDLGLASLAELIQADNIRSVALPMLGCGEGRLAWPEVRDLIVRRLSHLTDVSIYVYGPML